MSNSPSATPQKRIPKRRVWIYTAIAALLPFGLLAIVELGLRAVNPRGGLPLFVPAEFTAGDYLVANRTASQRWFGRIPSAPAPALDPFAREKPGRGFRVFVLGESTTAGFPFPRNVAFSRLIRDVLTDVLPRDSVEVINLGIAATNSFALLDMAKEIADQRPDAVLIYAGHNEYYGVLGAASRVGIPGGAAVTRAYLRLLRSRIVLALRDGLAAVGGLGTDAGGDLEAASLMEVLARDRLVALESALYSQGTGQFEANLARTVRVFTGRGIPVLVGSLASNLRDHPPFAAEPNHAAGGAVSVFDSARMTLAAGDTLRAAALFERARDLDVVRFRAPGEFNAIVRRVAVSSNAVYVPVAEEFAAASGAGIPGADLFLEHVHPNRSGYALMGQIFFRAMASAGALPARADTTRLRGWPEYADRTTLTPFDERVAFHTVRTLTTRWPFVPVDSQLDYRASYRPEGVVDSVAFAVSRGASWHLGKTFIAGEYARRGLHDSAAAEYAGLARDAPFAHEPHLMHAGALERAGREDESLAALARAVAIRPTGPALARLGQVAARRRDFPRAAALLRRSLALDQNQPQVLYQLSLTYGMANDIPQARATALQLSRLRPDYPGLADWLATLGVAPGARAPAAP